MRRTTLLRAVLAVALLGTALSPLGSTAQVPTKCPDEIGRTRRDGWIRLANPAFSKGRQYIKSWAASPFLPDYLLATNGATINRSPDGGCSWEEVYSPGLSTGEIEIAANDAVEAVALPPSPLGRLGYPSWAVVSDLTAGSYVVTSQDQGQTWTRQPSVGLPLLQKFRALHVAADPRIAFVLGDVKRQGLTTALETMLYVTHDGGATFAPVKRGLDVSQYTQLAVDPVDSRQLWAWDDSKLYRSQDSGLTFTLVPVPGPISTVDVLHYPAYEPARVIAFRADRAEAAQSDDGGVSWKTIKTPGRITGAANLYSGDALALTSAQGVYVESRSLGLTRRPVTPRGSLRFGDLVWAQSGFQELTLYAGTDDDLYLRRFTRALTPLPPVRLRGGAVIKKGPTSLVPADAVVTLRAGERETVRYQLRLAPVPTPIDVFFATDSTGSMEPVIASLRRDLQDIIDDLGKSGIDVWFGVGDFKDYPTHGQPTDHPYKRFRQVGPINDELESAIEAIRIGGGNGLDSALAATYQAATGEGQRMLATGDVGGGWWVTPGNGAEWRRDSLKVLVIAADVRSRDPQIDPGYPGPSAPQVIRKLNELGIEHVGLAVGNFPEEPFQSLSKVSRGTGTVAPPGGTDCDNDGQVDIRTGAPLVCKLPLRRAAQNGTNLAPAMVGLLSSLEDLQTVSLGVTGDRRVAKLDVGTVDAVNVKTHNQLTYDVDVNCSRETAGDRFRYAIEAKVGPRVVAATGLTVVCEPLPVPRRPVPQPAEEFPPPVIRALAAAAVPPPPAPPAPVPQPQPNPQSNPNPNPNPMPQVGMAVQDQIELQIALAHAEIEIQEEDQLAMSGLRHEDAAAAAVLCAGMVMTAGAAVGLRRRLRTEPVRVRSSG